MRISEYLDRAASLYPEHEAFVDGECRLTFNAACDYTHWIAHALTGPLELEAGARVAVYSPNAVMPYLAVLGINRADMTWLPINSRNALDTNIGLLEFFSADCLIYHSQFEDQIATIKKHVPSLKRFVCVDGESSQGQALEGLLENCRRPYPSLPEDPNGVAAIQATGGTTGPSKGVVLTHRNLESQVLMMMLGLNIPEQPRYLVVAPMTHAAGFFTPVYFARGGTTVVLSGFDAHDVLQTIEREKITHLFLPPTAIYSLLDYPALQDFDCSSLRGLYSGAAPIAPKRFKQAVDVFGPCLVEVYGQSETLFPLLAKTPNDYLDGDGNFREQVLPSAGRQVPNCRVEIMDDQGNILGPGETGEIVVRGSSVMSCYYENEEATKEVSSFGWHHTTDVGIKDAQGYITIVDRKKDMIITGGFNVYPVEIENLLNTHPAIHDCSVIGVPDDKWGEAIKAVVQLKRGERAVEEELIAMCKEKLGSVKAPKSVEFWDELPVSPVGKVLKREIRQHFWQDKQRAVN